MNTEYNRKNLYTYLYRNFMRIFALFKDFFRGFFFGLSSAKKSVIENELYAKINSENMIT